MSLRHDQPLLNWECFLLSSLCKKSFSQYVRWDVTWSNFFSGGYFQFWQETGLVWELIAPKLTTPSWGVRSTINTRRQDTPRKDGPHPHPACSVKLSQTLQRASACFWSLLQMLQRNKCLCRLYRELRNQHLLEWDSDRWMVGKLLSGSLMGTPGQAPLWKWDLKFLGVPSFQKQNNTIL